MSSRDRVLSEEEVDRLAENEVLGEARDVLAGLDVRLQQVRTGDLDRTEAARILLQDASNLHLKARSVSLTGLAPLTHRLEDYLSAVKTLEDKHIDDLQTIADRISSVLDGDDVPVENVAEVMRSMPHKPVFDVEDITFSEVEVMLVMPQRTAAKIVARELAACGYRVSTVLDPLEAIALATSLKPDMVITAQVMPRLSGVDLSCALNAMPSTKKIPVALLTSLERGHPDLASLPMSCGLIRRGPQFGDDLANVLDRFGIT